MTVLITGGAGFIGSNLVRHLNATHPELDVRVLDDLSTGFQSNMDGLKCRFLEGSILDPEALVASLEDVDSIVHLAAIPSVPRSLANPVASNAANVSGTLSVLEAARVRNVKHVVVASSSSVYGANPSMPKRELDWTRPMSPYAVSKLAAESYAMAYRYSYGLETLAFRFFNVFGPYQAAGHAYAAVIPKYVDAALNGRAVEITGDGTQSRDFTFVGTVCSVIERAVTRRLSADTPINLAYGTSTSLLELIALMEELLGTKLDRTSVESRAGDVVASQADSTRIRALVPEVSPVSLESGLKETIEWFRAGNLTR